MMTPEERERRWKLHVEASSWGDYTFWVTQDDEGRWVATEVETGVRGSPSNSPREAMDNYWNDTGYAS